MVYFYSWIFRCTITLYDFPLNLQQEGSVLGHQICCMIYFYIVVSAIMHRLYVLMCSTNLTTELEYFEKFVFLLKLHLNDATSVSCHLSNLIRSECNTLSDTHTTAQGSSQWGKFFFYFAKHAVFYFP